jgi:hypothetical protein
MARGKAGEIARILRKFSAKKVEFRRGVFVLKETWRFGIRLLSFDVVDENGSFGTFDCSTDTNSDVFFISTNFKRDN